MMNREELIKKGIRIQTIADTDYFYVADIKEKLPGYKIDTEKIIYDSNEEPIIESQHIKPMTNFDKKIKQSLMFKPKNDINSL